MSERNGLEGFDIEGAINRHYDSLNSPDATDAGFSGNASVTPYEEPAVEAPVAENLPIIGGHEDHDHPPLVVNPPFIILQYGQSETGENVFGLNAAGIMDGIPGVIAQLRETLGELEAKLAAGEFANPE